MRLALVCFYCLCVFVYVLYFIATMSFAGYFLSVLFCLLSMLISDSRFDLVWFRLSCDHGWIRSGSVNVRKQQHYTVNPMLLPSGNLFKCREEVLYLHPMIPPKRFDIFPLTGGCLDAFRFFFKQNLLLYRIILLHFKLYVLFCLLFCCVWWPGMANNVSVQYNGGSLPDIILLTQGYYHWGTYLNAMKRFCICSL